MFGRLLDLVPVRSSRLRIASEQLRKCRARVEELKASLDKARAKRDDIEQRAAGLRSEVAHQAKRVKRLEAQAAKADADHSREVEALRARIADLGGKRARDAADLRAHLGNTERDLAHARDHLMLIDTKLDILEGAANVLDNRTRAILSARTTPDPEVTSR